MNTFLVIFIFCFAKTFGRIINVTERRLEINNTCLIEYGIDSELHYKEDFEDSPLTDEQVYCVAACIYRNYGIMKKDGTIDKEKAETYFNKDDREERNIFFTIYDKCIQGNIACKLVQCMFEQLGNHRGNISDYNKISKSPFFGNVLVEFA